MKSMIIADNKASNLLASENHVFWQNNEAIKCWTNKGMAESIEKYKTIQANQWMLCSMLSSMRNIMGCPPPPQ